MAVLALLAAPFALAQDTRNSAITVAAASDLQYALPEICAAYTKQTGYSVTVTYGSSGNLSAQISNGAPYHVFLSADAAYPRALADKGAADPKTLTLYARGVIVFWTNPFLPGPWQDAVRDRRIDHIAIANPKHAPYGRAAEAALRSAGLYDTALPKLIYGENISQTAQFVQSGNAKAGFVALSLLQGGPAKGARYVQVALDSYPPLDQAAIVTRAGLSNPASVAFVRFLQGKEAQSILARYGFLAPSTEPRK